MQKNCLLALVLLLSVAVTSHAFAGEFENKLDQGSAALTAGKSGEAEALCAAALEINKDSHKAALCLGKALSRQGKRKEAEDALKRALYLNPDDPETNLEMGRLYINREVIPEAIDFLESAKILAPGTGIAEEAQRLLRATSEPTAAKRWTLDVSAGVQYDTNVVLRSDNGPLPDGISKEADARGITVLSGSYAFMADEKANLKAAYTFYQSGHSKLDGFNAQVHSPSLNYEHRFSDDYGMGLRYAMDFINVGGNNYGTVNTFYGALAIGGGERFGTTLDYTLSLNKYKDSDDFKTNTDRDGMTNKAGVTFLMPKEGKVFKLGGSFNQTSTDVDYLAFNDITALADFSGMITPNLGLVVNAQYEAISYNKADDPASGKRRADGMSTLGASVIYKLTDVMNVTLNETYIINNSNISDYTYKRSISSVILSARF